MFVNITNPDILSLCGYFTLARAVYAPVLCTGIPRYPYLVSVPVLLLCNGVLLVGLRVVSWWYSSTISVLLYYL